MRNGTLVGAVGGSVGLAVALYFTAAPAVSAFYAENLATTHTGALVGLCLGSVGALLGLTCKLRRMPKGENL